MRKEYTGEPRPENFIKRCIEWQSATGDYAHEAALRLSDPPVNISFTPLRALEVQRAHYDARLDAIRRYATCLPIPFAFPRISDGMMGTGGLSTYAPFYNTDPSQWPELMDRLGLTFSDRDLTSPPSDRILIAQG